MPRPDKKFTCCVCLGTGQKLSKLSGKDPNKVSWYTKLKYCISEIEWLVTYYICEECVKLLDVAYSFRETCLRAEEERQRNEEVDPAPFKHELDELDVKEEQELGVDVKTDVTDDEDYAACNSGQEDAPEDITYGLQRKKKRKKLQFSCEKCDSVFNSSIKLVNHCIKDHAMQKLDVRPFICDRCPSRFCNSSNLLQHVKYHDAVRSNMCTYCGKGFITKTDLNIHEKQHLNKREYRCDECGKCFNTHKDIRSHKLVVHTASTTWKYCCEICNKPFPIKSNYDSHMRRHTGDKKFECHLCQRKFTDKCVLQRHMRTHSNVREYKCAYCSREYKDQRVLKVHMAKIHSIGIGQIKIPLKEKKYICHICPKSYYAKNKLTRHLYTHSGEKPYDCPVCGKKFNDKSYVKQHLRKTHNLEEMQNEKFGFLATPEDFSKPDTFSRELKL